MKMEECKTLLDETDDGLTLYSVTTFSTNYTQSNNIGPGRTLDRMFQFWGKKLEHSLGRAVEVFGYRPAAIGERIERRAKKLSFPNAAKKTSLSGALTGAKWRIRRYRLKRDCKRLLRYLKMDVPSRQSEALEVLIKICSSEQAVRKEMLELNAGQILQTLNQKLVYISEHMFPELRKRALDAYKLFAQGPLQIEKEQLGLPLSSALVHPIPNDSFSQLLGKIIQSFRVGDSKTTGIFLWWRTVEHPVDKKSSEETFPRCYSSDSGYPFFMIQIEQNKGLLALRLETRRNEDLQTVHSSMQSSIVELLQAHSIHLHTLRMPQDNMEQAGASSIASIVDNAYCPLFIDLVLNYTLNAEHLLILWLLLRRWSKWTLLAIVLIWFCIGGMKCKV